MRTEQDLRAAFTVLEDNAPLEIADLVDESAPRHRLRTNLTLAAAAATVVAVAVGVPALVSRHNSAGSGQVSTPPASPPPAAHPEAPVSVRYSFTVGSMPGYTFTPYSVHRNFQRTDITIGSGGNGQSAQGQVYVFAPGAFDPASAKRGKAVPVNGHPGYFASLALAEPVPNDNTKLPAVVWQYAPNAWAMVQADFRDLEALRGKPVDAQAEEVKIAREVHTDQPQALRVPFRFGYLPPGVVTEGGAPEQDGVWVYLGDGRPGDAQNGGFGSALSLWYYPSSDANGVFCHEGTRKFTVDGRGGCFMTDDATHRTTGLYLNTADGLIEMLVDSKHVGIYTDEQLKHIATSLQLANIHDRSTWFDGTTVMPQ
jgi:hypothetical protein